MAKIKTEYVCSNCGYKTPRWNGKCPDCNEWNTLIEELMEKIPTSMSTKTYEYKAQKIDNIQTTDDHRYKTNIGELDNVLGGGIVKGSLILLSGDPGIGKSTILLQMCGSIKGDTNILYVTGEESPRQLKIRAERLEIRSQNTTVIADTDILAIVQYITANKPDLVMIDSIQTMNLEGVSSTPGSITQVRECSNLLLKTAKTLDIPIIIVGHVNKEGAIAGPKVLEHIVDAVLYFEGDRNLSYRVLRAVKNRFGSTNEIGVFEMQDRGLVEVQNPSLMLLSGRPKNSSGTCVACVMEGSRPILAEIQGLVCTTGFGNPRRMATGFDYNRLNLLLAVLEKRGGYFFSNLDAYINVIGGLKIDEPAVDLTVALALVSSLKDFVVDEKILAFGEVGLAGEIRAVNKVESRVAEAIRMGFERIIIPYQNLQQINKNLLKKADIIGAKSIRQAFDSLS